MSSIQNGQPNLDVARYQYRKLFRLSAEEMEREPMDEMQMNLFIHQEVVKQQEREMKHG